MIETWLQVSCDGCDDDDATSFAPLPNTTRAEFRKELHSIGWKSFGTLDYCPRCVASKKHLKRRSIFDAESID